MSEESDTYQKNMNKDNNQINNDIPELPSPFEQLQEVDADGWHFINIWECQLKPKVRQETLESLVNTLKYINFTEQKQKQYELSEESYFIAAEEMEEYGV